MDVIDLCSGLWGWSSIFAARGHKCVGIDRTAPPSVPDGCRFFQADIIDIEVGYVRQFDFGVASTPCEEFSLFGMKNFHPDPPYPDLGIKLFNHARTLFEESGIPFVMENVRPAQEFVGRAAHHCGPFYLWGSGVPPLMPQGITKGMKLGGAIKFKNLPIEERRKYRMQDLMLMAASGSPERLAWTKRVATIPPELANCVADYAERILVAA